LAEQSGKVKITDPTRILTVANIISLLRALMAFPIIYSLRRPEWQLWTFVLIVIAVLSDALDGYFARRAHEVTHIGKWLDPIADFVVIISVTFYLVLFNMFPTWFFIFFLLRYLSIALPALYLINHTHFIMSSNRYGKWAIGISAFTITLHIFRYSQLDWLRITSLWVAVVLLLISWLFYTKTFVHEIRRL
jgi:CDP-diacylglycerol--glycerol-3-phosphate 3-phosphatidyltransferase